jgi:MFS transporter, DHA1 family, inner membrane transport protein
VGCALAPNYGLLLAARLLMAACHGLFFGVAMVLATGLAPPGRQATALSLIMAGVNAATIAGIPLGAAIGNAYGWRTSFWIIAGLATLAGIVLAMLIPNMKGERPAASDFGAELRAVLRPAVLICFALIAITLMGVFAFFTYIVPILTEAVGIPIAVVPWVLFAMGVAGFFGNIVAGWLADRYPVGTMMLGLGMSAISLVIATQVIANPWLSVPLLCLSNFFGFMFPAPVQARILKEIADAPNFGSTLISTAFQVGIASGAAIGGFAIASGWSYASLPLLFALFQGVALLGTFGLLAYERRRRAVPA